MPVDGHANRVAGDARLRPGQQPLLSEKRVQERRLARVWPADDSDADWLGRIEVTAVFFFEGTPREDIILRRFLGFGGLRQGFAQRGVKVGEPLPVFGRQSDGVAEIESFVGTREPNPALGLIGNQNGGLAGPAYEAGEMPVRGHEADAAVGHEHDRIRLGHSRFGLRAHASIEGFSLPLVEPGRVDDGEAEVAEPGIAFAPVACHAGQVIDQRQLLADQPVEQRRLADVRTPDDGDGKRHQGLAAAGACPMRTTPSKACARWRTPAGAAGSARMASRDLPAASLSFAFMAASARISRAELRIGELASASGASRPPIALRSALSTSSMAALNRATSWRAGSTFGSDARAS